MILGIPWHRAAMAATLLLLLAWSLWQRAFVTGVIRRYFQETTGPISLAVFRILVFGLFVLEPPPSGWFVAGSKELMRPLPGWEALLPHLPLDPGFVDGASRIFLVAAVLALTGTFTRVSAAVATLLAFYLYGIPQFFGKVNHLHHLVWFAALLAASPAGEALSVDAIVRRLRGVSSPGPGAVRSAAYAVPIRAAWLLMGLIYLFPGLWKLWTCGPAWMGAANVRGILYQRWMDAGGYEPPFRADRSELLCSLGGPAVVAFEVLFIVLVLFPRVRPWAAVFGVVFHLANGLFLKILFLPLLVFYLTFVDWDALLARIRRRSTIEVAARAATRPALVTAAVLLVLNGACGVLGIDSWPFAVYPRFNYLAPETRLTLHIEAVLPGGAARRVDRPPAFLAMYDRARWEVLLHRTARMAPGPAQENELRRIWERLAPHVEVPGATTIRFQRVVISVVPERLHEPPVERRLLLELPVP